MTAYKTCENIECSERGKPFTSMWCWKCKSRLGPYDGRPPQVTPQAQATASEMNERARQIRAQREEWSRRTGIPLQDTPTPAASASSWRSSEAAGATPYSLPGSSHIVKGDSVWAYLVGAGIGVLILILGIIDKVSWAPKAAYCQLGAQYGAQVPGCTMPRLLGPFATELLILGVIMISGLAFIVWAKRLK